MAATYRAVDHVDHPEHEIRPDHEIGNTEGHETVGVERARGARPPATCASSWQSHSRSQ